MPSFVQIDVYMRCSDSYQSAHDNRGFAALLTFMLCVLLSAHQSCDVQLLLIDLSTTHAVHIDAW